MPAATAAVTPATPLRVAVVGLGAVGGLVAAHLARAGHEVSAVARGATLRAVRSGGLVLREGGEEHVVPLAVSDDPADLGEHDLVVVGLKAPALATAAHLVPPLLAPDGVVLPAMNGVPWWFLQTPGSGVAPEAARLRSIDPTGTIETAVPLAATLGCVVHLSSSCPAPGVVEHGRGRRLIVGEPAGGSSERVDSLVATLGGAGFEAEASPDVRREIWYKLWGNMTVNPVSALTGATMDRILDDDLVRGFVVRAMAEAAAVGARIGCPIEEDGEQRLGVTRLLGAARTSMLQDVDAGRAIEVDALCGVVHEIGEAVGVPTPEVDTLLGLTRLMGRVRGLYPEEETR